jgi:hypothetical protein
MSTTAQDLLPPAEESPQVLTRSTVGGLKVTRPASEGYINMIVYGDPGVGKTRFCGSASLVEAMSPVLMLDWEGGTMSLDDSYPDVEVVRFHTWKQVDQAYGDLYNNNPYKTIIVDSLTEAQKFCMGEAMREVVEKNPNRDRDVASVREWGKTGEQLRRFVRALRDMPCNTIFTTLQREVNDDEGKLIKRYPALPGQLKLELAGHVDIVGYMYQKEVVDGPNRSMKTLMLCQAQEKVTAKDRSGKLPQVMEEPTMLQVYEATHRKRETGQ